jgi:Tol biopolymer transport system component/DNA-binding winged helix-turn-helix (wHTH) protein
MSLPLDSSPKVRFGDFELDLRTAELRRNGDKFLLQGQQYQVLTILLERPGELVTRDELKKKLWPSDTFVDFDHSLNKAVNRLRETLADSAERPRFIETLPRRGYRFIGTVERGNGLPLPAAGVSSVTPVAVEKISEAAQMPVSRSSRPAIVWRWLAVGASVMMLLAVASVELRHRFVKVRPLSIENLEITKITNSGRVGHVAISPDGRYVAYATAFGDKWEIRLRQVATRSDVQVLAPDIGDFVGLTFSPDGNYIYFVRADRNDVSFRYLYSVPSIGGAPKRLITDVDSNITFSPDGREIAYEHWVPPRNSMELKVANADGTGERVLVEISGTSFFSEGGPGPSWSPDGRTIAVSKEMVKGPHRAVLFTISTADGTVRELRSGTDIMGRPVWRSSGDSLLFPQYDSSLHRTQLWSISFPAGIAQQVTHDASDYSPELDATRDGTMLATVTGTISSQVWSAPGSNPAKAEQFSSGDPPLLLVKGNREGKVIAVDAEGGLWMLSSDGKSLAKLDSVHDLSWFEICGDFIALTASNHGSTVLIRLNADGSHAVQLASGNLASPTCSQDGRFVYYANFEQPQKLWRTPIEGGAAVEVGRILGDSLIGTVHISPDGKFLVYPYSIYTVGAPGRHYAIVRVADGSTVKSFDMPEQGFDLGPFWSPDGKSLQYLLSHDGVSNIWGHPTQGGAPHQLTQFKSGTIFNFSWSADRKRLLLTRGQVNNDVVLVNGLK